MLRARLTGDYPTAQARHALRCRCARVRGFEVTDTYRYTHWPCTSFSLSSTLGVSEPCSLSALLISHQVCSTGTNYRLLVEPTATLSTARRFPRAKCWYLRCRYFDLAFLNPNRLRLA